MRGSLRFSILFRCLCFFGSVYSTLVYSAEDAVGAKSAGQVAKAVFAGGCFWCMEPPFDKLEGVTATISGYSGGSVKNPNYRSVSSGGTGHYEVIEVHYDADKVSYEKLLSVFWKNVDPYDARGQFCDKGSQYLSAIFYLDEAQRKAAEKSRLALAKNAKLPGNVVTQILPASRFYPAERYHQDYYQKNPLRYKFYRSRCGRDKRLNELWGS